MEPEFTQQGLGQHRILITTHYNVRISIPEGLLYVHCNVELCCINLNGYRKLLFCEILQSIVSTITTSYVNTVYNIDLLFTQRF